MTKLSWFGVLFSLFLFAAPAQAQEEPPAPEWQVVITGQVEAFRSHDAPVAMSFAAASFQQTFATPKEFEAAVRSWGYAAIMDSRSHSFGVYQQINETMLLQAVMFTGPDSILYEAIYQLNKEETGWRVGGVQLMKTAGMGA